MADKLYNVGLKAFIKNEYGQLLILQGSNAMEKEGLWGLPGGRINESETQVTLDGILRREIEEECGEIRVSIGEPFATWRFHNETKSIFLVGYMCKYLGGEITLSHEHKNYAWIYESEVDAYVFVNGYKEVIVNSFKVKNLLE